MFIRALLIFFLIIHSLLAGELQTPLEKSNFSRLTSHAEMMKYIQSKHYIKMHGDYLRAF